MADKPRKHDRIQGAFELGPRSLAELRKIRRLLEIAHNNGDPIADPGKESEDEEVNWPADS